jgi:hypothetical protein
MKIIATIISSLTFISLFSQSTIRPMCDDAFSVPIGLTYSGFIIQDAESVTRTTVTNGYEINLSISEEPAQNDVIYSEIHNVPFDAAGFFSLDVGRSNPEEIIKFFEYMNRNIDKDYYYNISIRDARSSEPFKYIGSKKINTVPYALVSNMLGGIGERGPSGPQGPQGEQGPPGRTAPPIFGPTGRPGPAGVNGFKIMKMTSIIPTDASMYVDDGTNTADGQPHLRIKSNNIWIDL